MTATAPRSRVSLKWKMLALLGLALLVVNGGLLSFQIYEREQALEAARASERAQHLRALERLLESSATRLGRVAAPWAASAPIFGIFWAFGEASKILFFSHRSKRPKIRESMAPGRLQSGFWTNFK